MKHDDGRHDNIHSCTQYTQIYTDIYKIIYTNIHNFMYIYIKFLFDKNINNQYDSYINTTCPVRQLEPTDSSSSRWNIAGQNANENTAQNSTRSGLLSIVMMLTRILYTVGHMFTVNNKKQ